jgi:hypothetical protein
MGSSYRGKKMADLTEEELNQALREVRNTVKRFERKGQQLLREVERRRRGKDTDQREVNG